MTYQQVFEYIRDYVLGSTLAPEEMIEELNTLKFEIDMLIELTEAFE